MDKQGYELSDLEALEAESVHIFREVAATFERPGMLFSGGKDSVVMFHLARKAFWPQGTWVGATIGLKALTLR